MPSGVMHNIQILKADKLIDVQLALAATAGSYMGR
jgi:hypothetical protein